MREDICRRRADYRVGGGLFYGCEVCWTCKYFPMDEITEGFPSYGCYWHPFTPVISSDSGKPIGYKPTVIENPGLWRCPYWTEKEKASK